LTYALTKSISHKYHDLSPNKIDSLYKTSFSHLFELIPHMSTLDATLHPTTPADEPERSDVTARNHYKLHFFLFMVMGSGANWVFPTALAQEIPYFEDNQPEGMSCPTTDI
jgi:hypothetical protein